MALSLDYMGKFMIVMVTIAVGISLIMTFGNQVQDSSPDIPGNDDETGTSLVKVESQQEVVELLNYCNQKSLEQGGRSFTCFLIVNNGEDDLIIDEGDVLDSVSFDDEKLDLVPNNAGGGNKLILYSGESGIIRYTVDGNKIVIEPGAADG